MDKDHPHRWTLEYEKFIDTVSDPSLTSWSKQLGVSPVLPAPQITKPKEIKVEKIVLTMDMDIINKQLDKMGPLDLDVFQKHLERLMILTQEKQIEKV